MSEAKTHDTSNTFEVTRERLRTHTHFGFRLRRARVELLRREDRKFMLGGCPYWRVVTCNEDCIREDRERAELLLKKIEETSYEELIPRQKEKFSGNEDKINDYQELDLDGYDKPKLKVTKSENIFKQYGFSFTAEGRIEHKQNFVEAQEEIKVNAKSGLQRAALSTVSLLTKKPI